MLLIQEMQLINNFIWLVCEIHTSSFIKEVKMGISFRKRIKLDDTTTLNIGKKGSSISKKIDDNITINSKGTLTINLGDGLVFKQSIKQNKNKK